MYPKTILIVINLTIIVSSQSKIQLRQTDAKNDRIKMNTWQFLSNWSDLEQNEFKNCQENFAIVADETDCNQYRICLFHRVYRIRCPSEQSFDIETNECVRSEKANCRKPITFEYKCPQKYGIFPHNTECDQYWVCSNHKPKLKHCTKNFVFDQKLHRCVRSYYVMDCHKEIYSSNAKESNSMPNSLLVTKPINSSKKMQNEKTNYSKRKVPNWAKKGSKLKF
ncbi:hypothetical protein SSS_00077 [Sarcoptes scabiei]|uniref:Chitin binding Peritrophin-A domain containing protein 7 n=1 Tax=Sarcoptes scabiei TaxID=52283 RepID=A0A132A983_SARSC|nr:hypothetical protein SSS_00077 [Sarcoptes scabiei]KPM07429.1 Chitin binding Peritrophin-A domain containing protein 7 [Sarcoptes scabiei]